jgi:anti-sigma B factor antagonist
MKIDVKKTGDATVVALEGDIDANTASAVQQQVQALAVPGCRVALDMTEVGYMSSAGLRMLLSTYRQISGNKGKVVLVGLAESIRDTMSNTGFLSFFETHDDLSAGLAALAR